MSGIGGLGLPSITQPTNNPSPPQETDTSDQSNNAVGTPPPTQEADTGNQTGNDTPNQDTSTSGSSGATNTSNANTAPSDQTSSTSSVQKFGDASSISSGSTSDVVQTVVEFKLSEPPVEQLEQDARTAALEAQRAYQLQSFVDKLADEPRSVDLGQQANSEAVEQANNASSRPDAEQVAVAPLAPDL
ncbi:MAG: hypothetical protein ABJF50_04885 [Paracoccaceae bacterium]